jgi:hypothetical protein
MVKKNQNYLEMIHDSINRLKIIKEQDPGDNEIFSSAVNLMIGELFEKEHEELSKKFVKTAKRNPTKTSISETKSIAVIKKGNDKNG